MHLESLCEDALKAVRAGNTILILSDEQLKVGMAPMSLPCLLPQQSIII